MNLYLSIAFTLLAGVAGMYLLAKTKAEQLGKFYRFVSYFVLLVTAISLLCQLTIACMYMVCCTPLCPPSENCMPGMMHGNCGGGGMHSGCSGMEDSEDDEEHCGGMDKHEKRGGHHDMKEHDEDGGHMHEGMMKQDSTVKN